MKKSLLFIALVTVAIVLTGCGSAERIMYTNLDKTGELFLNHYTTLIPSLGPCGFSRNEDMYDIKIPRIKGRLESDELVIWEMGSSEKYTYSGYIEFIQPNKLYVNLYKTKNGVKSKLTINGTHTIKVEDNRIGDVKI